MLTQQLRESSTTTARDGSSTTTTRTSTVIVEAGASPPPSAEARRERRERAKAVEEMIKHFRDLSPKLIEHNLELGTCESQTARAIARIEEETKAVEGAAATHAALDPTIPPRKVALAVAMNESAHAAQLASRACSIAERVVEFTTIAAGAKAGRETEHHDTRENAARAANFQHKRAVKDAAARENATRDALTALTDETAKIESQTRASLASAKTLKHAAAADDVAAHGESERAARADVGAVEINAKLQHIVDETKHRVAHKAKRDEAQQQLEALGSEKETLDRACAAHSAQASRATVMAATARTELASKTDALAAQNVVVEELRNKIVDTLGKDEDYGSASLAELDTLAARLASSKSKEDAEVEASELTALLNEHVVEIVALKKALVLLTHDSAKLTNAAGVVASATRSAEQEKSSATAEAKEGRAAKAKTGKAVDTLSHATKKITSEAARYIAKLATAKKAAAKAVKKEATKHKKAETKERNKFAKECAKALTALTGPTPRGHTQPLDAVAQRINRRHEILVADLATKTADATRLTNTLAEMKSAAAKSAAATKKKEAKRKAETTAQHERENELALLAREELEAEKEREDEETEELAAAQRIAAAKITARQRRRSRATSTAAAAKAKAQAQAATQAKSKSKAHSHSVLFSASDEEEEEAEAAAAATRDESPVFAPAPKPKVKKTVTYGGRKKKKKKKKKTTTRRGSGSGGGGNMMSSILGEGDDDMWASMF